MTEEKFETQKKIDPKIKQYKYVRLLQDNNQLTTFVRKFILKVLSEIINDDSETINVNTPIKKYGITSNSAPQIKKTLEISFGEISKKSNFEDLTLSDIQDHILQNDLEKIELFLTKRFNSPAGELKLTTNPQGKLTTHFTGNEFYLKDHKVRGNSLLPGVVYLELVAQAMKKQGFFPKKGKALQIDDIVWIRPLVTTKKTSIIIDQKEEPGRLEFTISDSKGPLSQCQASIIDINHPEKLDLDNISSTCNSGALKKADIYSAFSHTGIQYGPSHQAIDYLHYGNESAVAKIHLPDSTLPLETFLLHPSLLDAAVHSSIGLSLGSPKSEQSAQLPFGADQFQLFSELPESVYAWVRYSKDADENASLKKFDIDICDENGNVCARFHKFTVRKVPSSNRVKDSASKNTQPLKPLPNIDKRSPQIEEISVKILWATLDSLGLFKRSGFESFEKLGIQSKFERWLEKSIALLTQQGYLSKTDNTITPGTLPKSSLDQAWDQWNRAKKAWQDNPHLIAQANLLEPCLKNLTPVLQGSTLATDVIFPESSMALVENIYKNNAIADFFNESLCDSVVQNIEAILEDNPNKKLRLLEIGAGTGGTSARLFKQLMPYANNILEYCYTDISEAFLSHAKREYGPTVPYLKYKIFNTEFSPGSQDIESGYDIVIASNVLHATHNINKTIKNAKALLTENGLIAINEATEIGAYTHLTFGLLDGWWLYEDPDLRIQGAPLLSPSTWSSVLTNNGFYSVEFPVNHAEHLRQQIIIANSDGKISALTSDANIARPQSNKIITHDSNENSDLLNTIIKVLKEELSKVLCIPSEQINKDENLQSYGVDSIVANAYSNAIKKRIPFISAAMIYEHGSIHALAYHLIKKDASTLREVFGIEESPLNNSNNIPEAEPSNTKSDDASYHDDIAIIGVSGRYPGADNIDEFWQNIAAGKSNISEIPPERWKWQDYHSKEKTPGTIYTKWGAFIKDHDKFDADFFSISESEAKWMDPQERVLLETAYQCLEDAGYAASTLNKKGKIGVFVGVTNGFYSSGPQYFSMANRISFHFDFHGPSFAVDSACSSSLTSIHLAVESLRSGSSTCALVGGVNLILHPKQYQELCMSGMLSPDDKCRAFSAMANGFVDGEGAGVLLLKPLKKAVEDGDNIHGVIKATAVNSSGRTGRYATPKAAQQISLIQEAIDQAKIDARSISYIEAHATGTPMGDSVELMGINEALSHYTQEKQFCSIGSYKPNIGYCESASGIAAITKVLLQFRHKAITPSINCEQLNQDIDFDNSAIFVQDKLSSWEQPKYQASGKEMTFPRRAGVSSLGATGSNAHAILEEYIENEAMKNEHDSELDKEVILLSAKTILALKHRITDLIDTLENDKNIDLFSLAYTLKVGREHLKYRIAFVAENISDLINLMKGYVDKGTIVTNIYTNINGLSNLLIQKKENSVSDNINYESLWKVQQYSELLSYWVDGANNIPWERLGGASSQVKRLSLPTYKFDRKRYWLEESFYDSPVQKHKTPNYEEA